MKRSAIIIDDNQESRNCVKKMLNGTFIQVIGEGENGITGLAMIKEFDPDIIFLDIDMPGINGINLANEIKEFSKSLVVFITAYSNFAHKSYDIEACDYLVKPFSRERFRLTLKKIEKQLADVLPSNVLVDEILTVKHNHGINFIEQKSIIYIEAQSGVSKIYYKDQGKVLCLKTNEPLKNFEQKLNKSKFLRTHRSYLVNIFEIKRIESSGQVYLISLKSTNALVYLSKSNVSALYDMLAI